MAVTAIVLGSIGLIFTLLTPLSLGYPATGFGIAIIGLLFGVLALPKEEGAKADMKTKGGIALTGIVTILAMILVLA
ncbi:MAG: hypothetical protein ACOCX9_03530 [Spirochaetota bacterium]